MSFSLPWLPIVGAAIVFFVLGAIWYSFFAEAWKKELHKHRNQLDSREPTPYLISAMGCVLNSIAVAIVLDRVLPLTETRLLAAFFTAILLGGAVSAAAAAKHYAFAGWSWRLFAIDSGYDLTGFFLMGLIIAFLR